MTKREQYNLEFTIISTHGFRVRYHCFPLEPSTQTTIVVAELLDTLNGETQFNCVFENVENALNGVPYENFIDLSPPEYLVLAISPPNAIIAQDASIPLTDLKGLLKEWLVFLNS